MKMKKAMKGKAKPMKASGYGKNKPVKKPVKKVMK
jgi:hypothetical protein